MRPKVHGCLACGEKFVRRAGGRRSSKYCSRKCALAHLKASHRSVEATCLWCGNRTVLTGYRRKNFLLTGRAYCSTECGFAARNAAARQAHRTPPPHTTKALVAYVQSEDGRAQSSLRMRTNNPMSDPIIRGRVSKILRYMGHRPPIQGGNGKPLPVPQQRLLDALGSQWKAELPIATKRRQDGYPHCYKIDIANELLRIAVEVDGRGHGCVLVRERDRRKDEFLRSIGWTVLRFSNEAAMGRLEDCVRMVSSTILKSSTTTTSSPAES